MNQKLTAHLEADLTRLQFGALVARMAARTAIRITDDDRAEYQGGAATKALRKRLDRSFAMIDRLMEQEMLATKRFCGHFELLMDTGFDVSGFAASYGRLRAGVSEFDTTYGELKAVVFAINGVNSGVKAKQPERLAA